MSPAPSVAATVASDALPTTEIDFDRDVRPILADRCYQCHGPDPIGRTGDPELRLDIADGLFSPRDGGSPVIPGKPSESALLLRIIASDDEVRMPPPGDGRSRLSDKQIDIIRRWVRAGAVVPPVRPDGRFARPANYPFPVDNAPTPDRVLLGKTLFFDPRLSGSNVMSCAACHSPEFSWGDGEARSLGHGGVQLGRRTPTILNLAWAELLFWDGRSASLEEQALGPIQSAAEMNQKLTDLRAELSAVAGYPRLFDLAYPGEGISDQTIGKALAAYERTIVSGTAPFDRWASGDESAMTQDAKRGFALFVGKAACIQCHTGWNFTDGGFYDIGLRGDDLGRGNLLKEIDVVQHAFKTPTLRNVGRRSPYMHDGSMATLSEVIDLYNRGGHVRRPSLSPQIKPLRLTAGEKQDLIAFLRTLTSDDPRVVLPSLPK